MNSRGDPDWGSRVRPLIRARLDSGALQAATAAQTWAGPGVGKPCDACDSIIETDDTEFEIVFHDARTVRFHLGCHLVWEEEQQCGPAA